jgi:hypothetical protein
MEIIQNALSEKGLEINQLPEDIQEDIVQIQQMIKRYNEACDEFEELEEEDEETEKELNHMEEQIIEYQSSIAEKIQNIGQPETKPETVVKAEGGGAVQEQKKSSSVGWLIFGGLALVATLGVVNVWKKQ